jgi:hypothetical protein
MFDNLHRMAFESNHIVTNSQGVRRAFHPSASPIRDVRIDLRGSHVVRPEEFLDRPDAYHCNTKIVLTQPGRPQNRKNRKAGIRPSSDLFAFRAGPCYSVAYIKTSIHHKSGVNRSSSFITHQ